MHNRKIRSEAFASYVLKRVFPGKFDSLINADKPDLQSLQLDIGIEVTTAESSREKEASRYVWFPFRENPVQGNGRLSSRTC